MKRVIPAGLLAFAVYQAASYKLFTTRVENATEICGPLNGVFDVVTTAKHWPEWHPATLSVSGAISCPMKPGDEITEHVSTAGLRGVMTWTVKGYNHPYSLILEGRSGFWGRSSIHYIFQDDGQGKVEFKRILEYAFLGFAGPVNLLRLKPAVEKQSVEAMSNLKALVERELPR